MTAVLQVKDRMVKAPVPDGWYTVTFDKVRKPRTTGPRSQNNAVWGHCADIGKQLDKTADRVYQALKRKAAREYGYPVTWDKELCEWEPKSQTEASTEEVSKLIQCVKDFADLHGLYLTEYIDGRPVKTLRGEVLNEEERKSDLPD